MTFIHEDPEFDALLRIVAQARQLNVALVEKDYWVTHALWALQHQGFDIWFKGGTSLSKGFGLIERFSEDLDLKVEPGRVARLPFVSNWKSEGVNATRARQEYFEALAAQLSVPGATVTLAADGDERFRSANLRVAYPGKHLAGLSPVMRPFVLLEVGSARVTPAVPRDMISFVAEHLEGSGQIAGFTDTRPRGLRCVHPFVTLLEKLDALMRRLPRHGVEPATFVRHFEDAARIIRGAGALPPLDDYFSPKALAQEMLAQGQIAALPESANPAFNPVNDERWQTVRRALVAIGPMFWGDRIALDDACADIRRWIDSALEG